MRFLLTLLGFLLPCQGEELKYAPSPVDNPLKGFVPYASQHQKERFPHSMEFSYLAMSEVVTGWGTYDWSSLEKILARAKERGLQSVFRVYLEYPGKQSGVPEFLTKEGVRVTEWKSREGHLSYTPDYEDLRLRRAMREFIMAMGAKYDGDPRIGFLTAGMLGSWGEWHNYPRRDLWASKEVQKEIIDAYEEAFKATPVLLRYPIGQGDEAYADNRESQMGYHDDSFAWATLESEGKDWFFATRLKRAGLLDKWKHFPIGGEVRPELWPSLFTDKPHSKRQNFLECVEVTHVSWLMDSGLFSPKFSLNEVRKERGKAAVQRMGYELYLKEVILKGSSLTLKIKNRGVAPFYQNWPIELVYSTPNVGNQLIVIEEELSKILPEKEEIWTVELPAEPSHIQLRVPNPMEGGKSLRFANQERNGDWVVVTF